MTFLKQFVKRRHGGQNIKIGVLYATVHDGVVGIGWSLCSKGDVFNPEDAERIAMARTKTSLTRLPFISKFISTESFDDKLKLAELIESPNVKTQQVGGMVFVYKNLIPDSLKTDLSVFISRCIRYFGNPQKEQRYEIPFWALSYYKEHKDYADRFFKKLEGKKEKEKDLQAQE